MEHSLGSSVLENSDVVDQIKFQLVYRRTYHVITQQNIRILQKPKQIRRKFLEMGLDKMYDVKRTEDVDLFG